MTAPKRPRAQEPKKKYESKRKKLDAQVAEPAPKKPDFKSFLAEERASKCGDDSAKQAAFDKRAENYLRLLQDNEDQRVIDVYKHEVLGEPLPHAQLMVNLESCSLCNTPYVKGVSVSSLFCEDCGRKVNFIDTSSSCIAFGEEIEFTSSPNQKVNHLKEFFTHFQCKETTNIEPEKCRAIMEQLYLNGIRSTAEITDRAVKKALKALGWQRYYDITMQIWIKITGRKPIVLHHLFIGKVHLMFRVIQSSFRRHCPPNRKNLSSYPFLLFKFSQLLGYNHLLPYFSLLKGPKKLAVQEEIFRKICLDVGWPFIPIPKEYIPAN